jgi:MinD-like ATPase involved in chromosome partitioning or flagellar assembly
MPLRLGTPCLRPVPPADVTPELVALPESDRRLPGGERSRAPAIQPVSRPTLVAVTGVGGGAGRTTVAAGLGLTFVEFESCRVGAIDATPRPVGTLRFRVGGTGAPTVHQYLSGARLLPPQPGGGDPDRLRVLAGESPESGRGLGRAALAHAVVRLSAQCPLLVLDCQPSPEETSWPWVHSRAAAVVFVVRAAVPDLQLLAGTLNAMERAGMAAVAHRSVVVINLTVPRAPGRATRLAAAQLGARVRSVKRLPYDPRLAGGEPVVLAQLNRHTRQALAGIAIECATRFR